MSDSVSSKTEKFEGFDIWEIRTKADSLKAVQELNDKPEMLKAVQKYIKEEIQESKSAIDIAENL